MTISAKRALRTAALLAALTPILPAALAQAPSGLVAGPRVALAVPAAAIAPVQPQRGRGAVSRGSVSRGGGSVSRGSSGSVSRGSVGSVSRGSVSRGSSSVGSISRGSSGSGSISRGSSGGSISRGTPSTGSISRGSPSTGSISRGSASTGSISRGSSSTPSYGGATPGYDSARSRGATTTTSSRGASPVPDVSRGTSSTSRGATGLTTRYDRARDAVTLDRPATGGTSSRTGSSSPSSPSTGGDSRLGGTTPGVVDLTPAARSPRVRFPKLNGASEGRPASLRPTTTPTSPERARTVRTNLLRDQVSRGSILERYRGPAGKRLNPTEPAADLSRSASLDRSRGGSSERTGGDLGRYAGRTTDTSRGADRTSGRTSAPVDLSTGRGRTRVATDRGRGPTSGRDGTTGAETTGSRTSYGARGTGAGARLGQLERVRAESPETATRMRRQSDAARRLSDVALRTSLGATAGVIGRYGGFGVGYGAGRPGYGPGYGYGSGIGGAGGYVGGIGTSFAFSVGFSTCWWGASAYFPCWSWCWPYYRSYCYWYSPWYRPRYACWYPSYYTPIYATYPVYYPVYVDQPVVVNGGGGGGVVAAAEEVVVEEAPAGAPPVNPDRTEELARAASQYLRMGDHAFREGRFGDAVHFYAKAIEYAPDEGVLYLILSDALFATGDYHYAAYAIRKAAELDRSLFAAPVDKHSFYGEPTAFDDQLATLERYLEDHYLDDDARLVLASNYLFSGRARDAQELLEHPFSEGVRGQDAGAVVLESAKTQVYGGR